MLLDEPSLGQDAAQKATLIRLAHALAAAGQLVILTTHDLTLAAQADRLLLLDPDGLAADGPPRARPARRGCLAATKSARSRLAAAPTGGPG